jgi:uncharacterized membrane protein
MDNSSTGKSALGMEGNVTALLGYIIGIVALILIFIEKDNKFVRFHALQSVMWAVAYIVGMILLMVVGGIVAVVVSQVSGALGSIVGLLMVLLYFGLLFGFLGGLIFAAIKSYGGNYFKLPIVGNLAEKYA